MSIVVTAVYVLRGLASVFFGPIANSHFNALTDAKLPEKLCTGILVATLLFAGIFPGLMAQMVENSLFPIVNRLHAAGAFAFAKP
jgi:NADH-quinone oxidoreductase subunit M